MPPGGSYRLDVQEGDVSAGESYFFPDDFISDCRSFSPSKTRSRHSPSHLPVISLVGIFAMDCLFVFVIIILKRRFLIAVILELSV
jgi:hypothetical protein